MFIYPLLVGVRVIERIWKFIGLISKTYFKVPQILLLQNITYLNKRLSKKFLNSLHVSCNKILFYSAQMLQTLMVFPICKCKKKLEHGSDYCKKIWILKCYKLASSFFRFYNTHLVYCVTGSLPRTKQKKNYGLKLETGPQIKGIKNKSSHCKKGIR